jgi:hypothetical protein
MQGWPGATHFSSLITGPISSSFLAGSVPFLKVSFLHATCLDALSNHHPAQAAAAPLPLACGTAVAVVLSLWQLPQAASTVHVLLL